MLLREGNKLLKKFLIFWWMPRRLADEFSRVEPYIAGMVKSPKEKRDFAPLKPGRPKLKKKKSGAGEGDFTQ